MELLLLLLAAQAAPAPGHWPQWQGPDRTHVSKETGLLREWPAEGPKLLWKAEDVGEGVAPVSVAGGLVFVLGYRGDKEFVTALDGGGKVAWTVPIGPGIGERSSMRVLGARAPLVDDDRLYVTRTTGEILCLSSASGRGIWKKSLSADLGGRVGSFFFCDNPLIDGNALVCVPGGSKGTVAALNKKTGSPLWQSAQLKDPASQAAPIAVEIGGVRQYVVLTMQSVAGIVARTGQLAWRADRAGQTVVFSTPVYRDGLLFVSSGYNVGCNAFRITPDGNRFKAEEAYSGKQMRTHTSSVVLLDDYLYGFDDSGLKCIEFQTGEEFWSNRSVGKGTVTVADGRLYLRYERGAPVALAEPSREGYREISRFSPPVPEKEFALSHPVVAGGRLYLRSQDVLYCYDVRGPDYKEPERVWNILARVGKDAPPRPGEFAREPDAVFVPTPEDVVAKMLELAALKKDDLVVDLGSGDGRILIAAAKKAGCRAVGYENDPKLVELSRTRVKEAKLDEQVTIEEKDLFTADLSAATVVTLYLGEKNNERLLPQLRKLKPGARIVSHEHGLGKSGPLPDTTTTVQSAEDGRAHTIFTWAAPLK